MLTVEAVAMALVVVLVFAMATAGHSRAWRRLSGRQAEELVQARWGRRPCTPRSQRMTGGGRLVVKRELALEIG